MDLNRILQKYSRYKVKRFTRIGKTIKPGKILFFGDSLTDIFRLGKYLPDYDTFNSGISGNTTKDLLDRINVSVYPYKPSAVVMLIGSNDIINEKRDIGYISQNYRLLLQQMKEHGIERILLQSCYPVYGETAEANREILLLNEEIKRLAAEYGCLYADIHPLLTDRKTGELIREYSRDGLHPNSKGYTVIAEALDRHLKKLLSDSRS